MSKTHMTAMTVRTTVPYETRLMAAIISMLSPHTPYTIERILRTVAFHFGFKLERI